MIEEITLLGPTRRSIVVETRQGTRISNSIEPEPGLQQRRRYEHWLKRFGTSWRERKPATGTYNCAGHVWASRRTSLHDPEEWVLILREDAYRSLSAGETPLPGDLAVYVDQSNGEILHIAEVLELREGLMPGGERKPWVLSKWNDQFGEVMHWAHDVPYSMLGFSCEIQWKTDRPLENGR